MKADMSKLLGRRDCGTAEGDRRHQGPSKSFGQRDASEEGGIINRDTREGH